MRPAALAFACAVAAAPAQLRANVPPPAAPSIAPPATAAPPLQAPAAPAESPEAKEREARITELQKEIATAMVREGVPGASVALVDEKGIVWMGGFGEADPARGRQADPGTPFAAAALSPLLVGLLAVRHAALTAAAEPGASGPSLLDVPIDDAALNLNNPFARTHALTLATLLEQTAGLEDLAPAELLFSDVPAPFLSSVLRLRAHPSRWAPGLRFSPSRVGIAAAAAQLERWTKHPFFAIADAELFTPLGLRDSTFRPEPSALEALAVGRARGRAVPWREPLYWPALGFITSAQDLASLLRLLIARGLAQSGPASGQRLISQDGALRLERGRTLGYDSIEAPGLGTRLGFSEGRAMVGLSGTFAGGASALAFFPREKVGYAVLLNAASPEALDQISTLASRFLLRDTAREPLPEPPRAPAELSRAAGVWRLASVRLEALRFFDELFGFTLVRAGPDSLEFSASLAPARTLVPAGRGAFRAPADARASVALAARPAPSGEELVAPEGTYLRASELVTFGRLGLAVATLVALLSSLLFALFWLPSALFGRLKNSPELRLRGLPALAALVLLDIGLLLFLSEQPLGARNLTTLLLCVLTLVFPALSLAALLDSLLGLAMPASYKSSAHRVRAHAFACSLLACWLSLEMVLHGLAGIRTWRI